MTFAEMGAETGNAELLLVAAEPYPIHAASPQWCSLLGVSEHDLKGCGFKVFDKDLIAHTQVLLFSPWPSIQQTFPFVRNPWLY